MKQIAPEQLEVAEKASVPFNQLSSSISFNAECAKITSLIADETDSEWTEQHETAFPLWIC